MPTDYLHNAINLTQRRRVIKGLLKLLREHSKEFDGIAFRGMSGSLVAPILCDVLRKKIIMVRKPPIRGDAGGARLHHSSHMVEYEGKTPKEIRWIFLDDCVASGTTFREVLKAMKEEGFPVPVAKILYNYNLVWDPF